MHVSCDMTTGTLQSPYMEVLLMWYEREGGGDGGRDGMEGKISRQ